MANKYKYLYYFSVILILPLSTEFYYFSRIIMCAGFIFAIKEMPSEIEFKKIELTDAQKFIYTGPIFFIMAVLYNPIIPVFLYERPIWMLLNIISAWMFWRIDQDYHSSKIN
ncbi:hypothetical protein N9K08_04115 [Gammaproteobacteria bacterium]|nr:hypothetical protein [Gammaproteobacteria bacterium]MDA9118149.1 hypothetical protein [Gammaproteobacteria bacterium]